ncbi:putative leucine-rich repeat domain superfamily [Helianthus annuus]|uniref:Leucine-rich repeat domain superfamily n=1 Tax=Helianthus annuus TaxID=4232 RepID=A0A9K3H3N2_HELAN|nr:putative leucine-rich repeat domain superfamily [Helianthus annuus]KAJ0452642.1 putative leucine-rich repeat domain superfamily [Helianthus annuus]KAJ0474551.1 putative leucine-rich repeat domain superfamily [Helianthus annuus]KAJ0650108.1 putative leucine-rich repeat domain superfamily [Helianthus annuus]KAJ0846447.1 putative leucine-rich repeat domain superfamily [Helianthus annuus]
MLKHSKVTDVCISHLVNNCKHIVHLNLSGCEGISDKSLQMITESYLHLESRDITRCVKITDGGLQHVMVKCSGLKSLNLYALSRYSCNLSDEALFSIAKSKSIRTLNLTWYVRVTDAGVIAIGQGCTLALLLNFLVFRNLFGIVGVTEKCLEALLKLCSNTLTKVDVNECIGIKRRSREELLQLFPYVRCFKASSGVCFLCLAMMVLDSLLYFAIGMYLDKVVTLWCKIRLICDAEHCFIRIDGASYAECSLSGLMLTQAKANSFIHCFVGVQKITLLHDLEIEICKSEGVKSLKNLNWDPF